MFFAMQHTFLNSYALADRRDGWKDKPRHHGVHRLPLSQAPNSAVSPPLLCPFSPNTLCLSLGLPCFPNVCCFLSDLLAYRTQHSTLSHWLFLTWSQNWIYYSSCMSPVPSIHLIIPVSWNPWGNVHQRMGGKASRSRVRTGAWDVRVLRIGGDWREYILNWDSLLLICRKKKSWVAVIVK